MMLSPKKFQTYEEVILDASAEQGWLQRLNGKIGTVMGYRKNGKEWDVCVELSAFTEKQVIVPESTLRAI